MGQSPWRPDAGGEDQWADKESDAVGVQILQMETLSLRQSVVAAAAATAVA